MVEERVTILTREQVVVLLTGVHYLTRFFALFHDGLVLEQASQQQIQQPF